MSFSDKFANGFKRIMPSPFSIALILTLFVLTTALLLNTDSAQKAELETFELKNNKLSIEVLTDNSDNIKWNDGNSNSSRIISLNKSDSLIVEVGNTTNGYKNKAALSIDENGNYKVYNDLEKSSKFWQLISFWESEMWKSSLLGFLVQMMLMLLLGHILALSKPIDKLVSNLTQYCISTSKAAAIVAGTTIFISLFNWGLGLIFGAILARKVGEHASKKLIKLNYGLIGTAGYSGLMVWHGGISGSAPIKVSDEGSIQKLMQGSSLSSEQLSELPSSIPFEQTVFSTMNITISIALVIIIPLFIFWLGKKVKSEKIELKSISDKKEVLNISGAEKIDHSKLFSLLIGFCLLVYSILKGFYAISNGDGLRFINPNFINLTLLALCFIFHQSIFKFLKATDKAISGTSGILIQFPLYFGILGIMKGSGLMAEISDFFINISNEATYPIFTFFSAGLVNIFVPSGGGQWVVQGPIVIEAATNIGVPLNKSVMALSYGDQITNMLQPFWALPLLGITGLKAKQILPYTLLLMLVGTVIFLFGLMVF